MRMRSPGASASPCRSSASMPHILSRRNPAACSRNADPFAASLAEHKLVAPTLVSQRTAWKVADQLGWETTYDAEYVALTQLQADIFVTSDGDLARAVAGLVETATIDALRTA